MLNLPKNILIKTYQQNSGLLYLGLSLYQQLKDDGHNVFLVPKTKYVKENKIFKKTYPSPNPETKDLFLNMSVDLPIAPQLIGYIQKHRIQAIISFETLMETSKWVDLVKRECPIKIIDVPMLEWVSPNYFNNKSYNKFDEIWALTNITHETFLNAGYTKIKKNSWNYVDKDIFYSQKKESEKFVYFHQASLNANYSSKNTDKVIKAFIKLKKDGYQNIELIISGLIDDENNKLISQHSKEIKKFNKILLRDEVATIYRSAHCVVAPSEKEGLGLSLYEARACGCEIITTNASPMNEVTTKYLCDAKLIKDGLIQKSIVSVENIYLKMKQVYEEKMSEKIIIKENEIKEKQKTQEEIQKENDKLMAAFEEQEVKKELDLDKLAALKAKINKKEGVVPTVVDKQKVSINMAFVGCGHAGNRICELLYRECDYDVFCINSSPQDLEYIQIPTNLKMCLKGTLGGCGKDTDLGRELFATHRDEIKEAIAETVDSNDMLFLVASGGGGTGSSSPETMIEVLAEFGKPVGMIYVLPKQTEDAKSKKNAVETLVRLAKYSAENVISCLIIVDNAKIEQIYSNLSMSKFWETANRAIIEPIHKFNLLTASPSKYQNLDPSDLGRIISCGDASIVGSLDVLHPYEETALAEAVIQSLNANMLADGFSLNQTRVGGVIIMATEKTLDQLASINIDYALSMVNEQTNGAELFSGIYAVDDVPDDTVRILTWFGGLGLPVDRVQALKAESQQQSEVMAEKEKGRVSAMTLDLEQNKVLSAKEQIERKIKAKASGFNKLQGGARQSIIDKRKR